MSAGIGAGGAIVGGSEGDGLTAVSAGIGDGGGMVGVGEGAEDGFVTVGAGVTGSGVADGIVTVGAGGGAGAGGGTALGGSVMITVADTSQLHSSYHFGLPTLAHVPVSRPPTRGVPSWTV